MTIPDLYEEKEQIEQRIKNAKTWFLTHSKLDAKFDSAHATFLGLVMRYVEIINHVGAFRRMK